MINSTKVVLYRVYEAGDCPESVPFVMTDRHGFADGKNVDMPKFLEAVGEGNSFFYEVDGENVIEGVDNDCYVKIKLQRLVVIKLPDGTLGAARISEKGHSVAYDSEGLKNISHQLSVNLLMNSLYHNKIKINKPDRCHNCVDWYFPQHEKQNVCKVCGDYLATP